MDLPWFSGQVVMHPIYLAVHDRGHKLITCPLLVLWSLQEELYKTLDVLAI
jgi:hypothetical protein